MVFTMFRQNNRLSSIILLKTIESTITVTGIINDIVRGTVNESQGNVLVNGLNADVWRVNAVPIYDISGSNIIFRSIVDFSSYRDDNGTGIAVTPRYVFLTTGEG